MYIFILVSLFQVTLTPHVTQCSSVDRVIFRNPESGDYEIRINNSQKTFDLKALILKANEIHRRPSDQLNQELHHEGKKQSDGKKYIDNKPIWSYHDDNLLKGSGDRYNHKSKNYNTTKQIKNPEKGKNFITSEQIWSNNVDTHNEIATERDNLKPNSSIINNMRCNKNETNSNCEEILVDTDPMNKPMNSSDKILGESPESIDNRELFKADGCLVGEKKVLGMCIAVHVASKKPKK